jgi:sugar diacid utilization regulator
LHHPAVGAADTTHGVRHVGVLGSRTTAADTTTTAVRWDDDICMPTRASRPEKRGRPERPSRLHSAPVRDDALVAIAARIRGRKDELARQIVDRFRAEIVDYRLADVELQQDFHALTLANIDALLDELESGEPVSDEQLERVRHAAAQRVHEVSLEAFMRAWRLFGQTVWAAVLNAVGSGDPAEHKAALEAAARLLRHVDAVTTAGVQAYLEEVQSPLGDLRLLRRDLLESLVSGKAESEQTRRRAQSLSVQLGDAYVVVVVRGAEARAFEAVDRPATYAALRRIVGGMRAHLRPTAGRLLVGVRGGEVIALYPVAQPSGVDSVKAECIELATALAADGISIGTSGWHAGVEAIATGYEEARAAERLAEGTGSSGRALTFDEVLIDHIVRSSPLIERALDDTLHPLVEYDRVRRTELIPTLRAYVDAGFNVTRSAAVLHVHPNSVVYRLRRIKELTGRDVHDPNELLVLVLSMKRAALTV